MSDTALVTGASGGIGHALATVLARNGHDLVLVARSHDRLQEVAASLHDRYGVLASVLPADLADPGAPQAIFDHLQQQETPIETLVNNAGIATYGLFHELDRERELAMIQLNIAALTNLTHLFVHPMLERGRGRILNLASTAAFQPGPLMATYYATKAYVLSFSEAIANELQPAGITVTALCPGPTESGFQARANMEDSRLVQEGLMDAESVAEAGYAGLMAGKRVIVPGMTNKIGTLVPRLMPRRLTTRLVRYMQKRQQH